ncbi:MAG TPA: hypothetical protein VK666_13070 [Chryseolinea sp.]|nr:hypothetical protein [Chryseolinea sp.]
MSEIKNLHLLEDTTFEQSNAMEQAALLHRRHGGIVFKILEYSPKKVIIQVAQERHAAGNYQSAKRLIEIVHETFDRFFKDAKVIPRPIVFEVSPANKVTSEWINKKMLTIGVRLKEIAADTGIEYSQLSGLVTGNKPLSQTVKAMFYFYFLSKGEVVEKNA